METPTGAADVGRNAQPTAIINLVHGTWGQRSRFLNKDSALIEAISSQVPGLLLRKLPWPGRNQLASRLVAADTLKALVQSDAEHYPRVKQFIVGHSHGGSAALYALRDAKVLEHVDSVICMSTPFIHVQRRALGSIRATILLDKVMAGWLLLAVIGMMIRFGVLSIAVLCACCFALVAMWVFSSCVCEKLAWWWEEIANLVVERFATPDIPQDKVLIVRMAADEASSVLGAFQIIAWLAASAWFIANATAERFRILWRIPWAAVVPLTLRITAIAAIMLMPAHLFSGSVQMVLMAFVVAAVVPSATIALTFVPVALAVAMVLGIAFGKEAAISNVLLRVSAEATPRGFWPVWCISEDGYITATRGERGLRHSVTYDNPVAVAIAAHWIKAAVTNQPRPNYATTWDRDRHESD